MIPLFKVRMSPRAGAMLNDTIYSGFIAQGPKVDELEEEMQKELGLATKPVAVNSATSALEMVLDLIGIGPGDEVISTPMTCFATNVALIRRGAQIRWADVDPATGNINPFYVDALVNERTKAIFAVNWAGQFAPYAYMQRYGIPLVEDAAHTWDSYRHSSARGDYIVYSLQAIKFLTAGDGGLLVVPPDKLAQARAMRWYGLDRDNKENFRNTQDIKRAGYKFNMNDIAATIGLANIIQARDSVIKHRNNAKYLYERLAGSPWLHTAPWRNDTSYWVFPVMLSSGMNRDHFERYLNSVGIGAAQVHFRNDYYTVAQQYREAPLPNLDYFSRHHTNLPCGWWMSREDLDYVVNRVMEFGLPGGA